MLTNEYLKRVYDGLAQRNANEPEFLQAVREVLESIQPVVEKHPEYEKAGLICTRPACDMPSGRDAYLAFTTLTMSRQRLE